MFNRLLNRFGLQFYSKTQEYRASYEATVTNISRSHQVGTLIIPAVASIGSQTLISEPAITVSHMDHSREWSHKEREDFVYKNKYLTFPIKLDPKQSVIVKQIFNIKVLPQKVNANKFDRKDYEKLDEHLRRLYLAGNEYLAPGDPEVIALAQSIAGKNTNVQKILEHINEWVIKHLQYGNPIPGLYRAQDVFRSLGKLGTTPTQVGVDCGGYDTVFVSLCQAVGIPARVVSGFWAGYHQNDMHAWVEILLPDGSWMPADPATEHLARQKRTRKSGKLGYVGSDRIAFSIGCDLDLEAGSQHRFATDILQNPIIYPENDKLEVCRIFSSQPL